MGFQASTRLLECLPPCHRSRNEDRPMCLDYWLETLEFRCRGWLKGLKHSRELDRLREKSDRLKRDLRQRYPLLVRHRAVIGGLRRRIEEGEQRVQRLADRIEIFSHVADHATAWRHALELEQTRKTLARDRAKCERLEQAYQEHLADVDRLKDRLADLQEKLYVRRL
jgi:chromosome segregation ATPase